MCAISFLKQAPLFGVCDLMWGFLFRHSHKAAPVRSLLAATSHAALGWSPILPSAPVPLCRNLWKEMSAREVTRKQIPDSTNYDCHAPAAVHTANL